MGVLMHRTFHVHQDGKGGPGGHGAWPKSVEALIHVLANFRITLCIPGDTEVLAMGIQSEHQRKPVLPVWQGGCPSLRSRPLFHHLDQGLHRLVVETLGLPQLLRHRLHLCGILKDGVEQLRGPLRD